MTDPNPHPNLPSSTPDRPVAPDFNIFPEREPERDPHRAVPWPPPPEPPMGRDTPDKGSLRSRLWATIIAVVAILGVMTIQQIGALTEEKVDTSVVAPPEAGDQYLLSSGITVKMTGLLRSLSGGKVPAGQTQMLAQSIEDGAVQPVDKFRSLVVAAEVAGRDTVLPKLDATAGEVEYPGSEEDFASLRLILEDRTDELSDAQRTALTDRHGYYGRLALSLGLPDNDPSRQAFFRGSGGLLVFFIVLGFFAVGVTFAAITCFIIMIVRIAGGKVRASFAPPMPGGSVYMETVAALAAGFLVLQLLGSLVVGLVFKDKPEVALLASLAMQWLLLPVIFWPVLRGVPLQEHARRIGWTKGQGVLREAGAGVFAYLASLPIFVFIVVVMVIGVFLYEAIKHAGGQPQPPQVKNEILEIISKGNPLVLAMFFLLATVWAPIVEESVFRGALFRHLRGGWGVAAAAIVSSLAFGVMHGYAFFMLAPVIALGCVFALMREWRGSLIAGITAHALHNGTLLAVAITMLTLAKPE